MDADIRKKVAGRMEVVKVLFTFAAKTASLLLQDPIIRVVHKLHL